MRTIPQKIYNKTKRLRTAEDVEKYFPGFLAFTDCTEQQIQSQYIIEDRSVLFWQEEKTYCKDN